MAGSVLKGLAGLSAALAVFAVAAADIAPGGPHFVVAAGRDPGPDEADPSRVAPEPPPPAPRNRALADLPDNAWVRLTAVTPKEARGGWAEVFWAYDARNMLFVHYGGCTSPYTNKGWAFDLGTETWTQRDPHHPGATGRPPMGCSRGMAYDSKRGLIWLFGGASSPDPNWNCPPNCDAHAPHPDDKNIGPWSYDTAAGTWTNVDSRWDATARKARDSRGRHAANSLAYDSVNDLLVSIGSTPSGLHDVWVFDIDKKLWRGGAFDPVEKGGATYTPLTFDPDTARFVYWTQGATWLYDAKADRWTRAAPKVEPPPRGNHLGMTYDSQNRAHILFGGRPVSNEDGNHLTDTWVYDAGRNSWTQMKPTVLPPGGDSMLFAYDSEHNVSVLMHYNPGRPMWAYRYKR